MKGGGQVTRSTSGMAHAMSGAFSPLSVFVRLRPGMVKGVTQNERLDEVIKAANDKELQLDPPANAGAR